MIGTLLAGLASLAAPVAARVLLALGFSVVTVAGVAASFSAVKSQITSSLGALPAAVIQLAGLGGAWVGLGLIFGAMTFAVSLWGLTKATSLLGTGG